MQIENEINLGPTAVTTDVEKYVHLLMDCYNDGFVLAAFVRVPEMHMSIDVTNWMSDQPYQAILTKENIVGYVRLTTGEYSILRNILLWPILLYL